MDASAIVAAIQSLSVLRTTIGALARLKLDAATLSQVTDAIEKLCEVQGGLLAAQAELFQLQHENQRLQRELQEAQDWKQRLSKYQLVQATGGAFVYRSKGPPEHDACPVCVEKQQLHILQTNGNSSGIYHCSSCRAEFNVDADRFPRGLPPSSSGWT